MKVLVTGAAGFIGRYLVARLTGEHEVWATGRSADPGVQAVSWVHWDMTTPLEAGVLPGRLDAVVHLAQSRDYRIFPDRAVAIARVNLGATLELLDHARRAGVQRFVFASSGGVYGGSDRPIKEDAPVRPPDFYLSTKLAAELLADSYRQLMDVMTLRLFFAYGRGQAPGMFVPKLVRKVLAGEPVVLYGREGIRVNPIHVFDVVDAIAASLALEGSHVVNVAGPDVLTLRRLTQLIVAHVGREPKLEERPAQPNTDLVADTGLMERMLVSPRHRLAERIGEVCEEAMAARP